MENTTATEATPNLTEAYETEPCSRCGGGGNYSYCQMYGTKCFGCSGKGKVYTKRGQAAIEYARSLRTIKAKDVQVGTLLFDQGHMTGKAGWFTVTKSEMTNQSCTSRVGTEEPVTSYYWNLETSQGSLYTFPDADVQCVPNKARLLEIKALALAYQATLTVKGKPSKVRAK